MKSKSIFVSLIIVLITLNAFSQKIDITYIANAGFLIEGNSKKVIIDALFDEGFGFYLKPSALTRELIINSQDPFNDIDIYLSSHQHADHFNANMIAEQLINSPLTFFIGTYSAKIALKTLTNSNSFINRTVGISPNFNEYVDITINDFDLKILRLHHDISEFENLGFLFEIDSLKILHVGDFCIGALSELEIFELANENIDIAFINYYGYFNGSEIMEKVRDGINAKQTILYHIENSDLNMVIDSMDNKNGVKVYKNSMDKYRFEKRGDTIINYQINETTGLNEIFFNKKYFIYPNPASQSIQVKAEGFSLNNTNYRIIGINGKVLQQGSFNSGAIDISYLEKGIFFLCFELGNEKICNKFVVE